MRPFLRLVIALAVPIVLTMTIARALTLPWYPALEYRRAGFPADPLGMPTDQRLRLAQATIHFLNIPWHTDSLKELQLPDGTSAYVSRELAHMDDVKGVYNRLTLFAGVALVGAALSAWGLARGGDRNAIYASIQEGAALTLLALISLGVWMAVAFNDFFTFFHGLFFQPGTWTFAYSDTLIRLFPLPFWQDAGIIIAGSVSVLSVLLLLGGGRLRRRNVQA